jgi:hypothetical protein
VKPAQEQRRTERIAMEIAATLLITKPYDVNLPFGRSKSTSYLVEAFSLYGKTSPLTIVPP